MNETTVVVLQREGGRVRDRECTGTAEGQANHDEKNYAKSNLRGMEDNRH